AMLHAAAACVAGGLRAADVRRETRVGLIGDRSPGMMAAVLGILQAGAAFVPLDGRQPDARLSTIVRASGVTVLMTDRASMTRARALAAGAAPVRIICWEDAIEDPRAGATNELPAVDDDRQSPADLAYIFYTSGSTGRPKGVMVPR